MEVETTFPPKPLRGPGRPKKGQEIRLETCVHGRERLKARNQSKVNFLVEERNSGKREDNPLWYRSRGVGELHPTLTGRGGVRLVTPPWFPEIQFRARTHRSGRLEGVN